MPSPRKDKGWWPTEPPALPFSADGGRAPPATGDEAAGERGSHNGWPPKGKKARGYGASLKHSASQRAEGKSIPLWRRIASKLIHRPEPSWRIRRLRRSPPRCLARENPDQPDALLRSTHRALYPSDEANAIENRPAPPEEKHGDQ